MFRFIPVVLLCFIPLAAQDGAQLYGTYCSACHAANGEGATGGQFPPLAASPWVEGDPARSINIVLHGLEGPIEVNGKPYNLIMPPQGAALPDDQIAAILTYVRKSWGNNADKIDTATVAKVRAEMEERKKPWTAPELLKLYPLPKQESPLQNLTSRIYHGEWKKLPKFDEFEAQNVEEEHDGIISLKDSDRDKNFGMVWEADFMAPVDGEYYFRFACDDGGRVLMNGEVVLEVHGIGPMNGARTVACVLDLKKGPNPIRIEYYQLGGTKGIGFAWRGPGEKTLKQLADTPVLRKNAGPEPILLAPTPERAAIYRNFIAGTTPRSIGIGFPGGINLAYSADHLAPELLWTGNFIDAGRHWTNRGQGAQPPAGDQVVKLTDKPIMPEGTRSKGYVLDAAGNPTFKSALGSLEIADHYEASDRKLVRKISVEGHGDPVKILLASTGKPEGSEEKIRILLRDTLNMEVSAPALPREGNQQHVLLAPGQSATLTYTWK